MNRHITYIHTYIFYFAQKLNGIDKNNAQTVVKHSSAQIWWVRTVRTVRHCSSALVPKFGNGAGVPNRLAPSAEVRSVSAQNISVQFADSALQYGTSVI